VLGRGEIVFRAFVFRTDFWIALHGFVLGEVGHRVVAENRRAILVFQNKNFVPWHRVGQGSARQREHRDQTEESCFHL
jgi:hypothetical protein